MKQNIFGGDFDDDLSPTVQIEFGTQSKGFRPLQAIKEYSYDTDLLTMSDSFMLRIPNIDGARTNGTPIELGDTVLLSVRDPRVQAGKPTLKLTGIAVSIETSSQMGQGSSIMLGGSDLGWHLANNTGPIFKSYRGQSINQILKTVIHPSWGIKGVSQGNEFNRRAKLGRAGVEPSHDGITTVPSPIQFEPGQMIADVLIPLARRQGTLINMSSDGYLQFFRPNYSQAPSYQLRYFDANDTRRSQNNVKKAKVSQKLDEIYTKVTCVGQVVDPPKVDSATTEPNAGRIRADAKNPHPEMLPFERDFSFSDCDQMNHTEVHNRAVWKLKRGLFDSWVASYTVLGHSQGGIFYEPDTTIDIVDTVNGVQGVYYVVSCHYTRDMQNGTNTELTVRKTDLLGA